MEETVDVSQSVQKKKMLLQRESTEGGKSRWGLVRNAIHFIRNTKENKEEKPDLGNSFLR